MTRIRLVPRGKVIGFTLVELLVVIGVIAVLISILLPTLASTRETSRRIKCASALRQYVTAAILTAEANRGFFPLSHRDIKEAQASEKRYPAVDPVTYAITETTHPLAYLTTDHSAFISGQLAYRIQRATNIDITKLTCPSRNGESAETWLTDNRVTQADGSVTGRVRNGYYYLPGRWQEKFRPTTRDLLPGEDPAGRSLYYPRKLKDKGKWIVASDLIEQGTSGGLGNGPQTSAPHGKRGFVGSMGGKSNIPHPEKIGSVGGNFAFLDGSVRWFNQRELSPYIVNTNGSDDVPAGDGTILGYFPVVR